MCSRAAGAMAGPLPGVRRKADRANTAASLSGGRRSRKDLGVKHISLDREEPRVKEFVRALPVEADGSLLELDGEPVLRVFPATGARCDPDELKAAILRRRDASRQLNDEWAAVDREGWERIPEVGG